MKSLLRLVVLLLSIFVIAQRSPAPIVEEKPTPAPKQMAKPKPTRVTQPKVDRATTPSRAAHSPTPAPSKRFAGSWTGVMHTFPWGDIPQTVTIDFAEETMTRARDWSSTNPGGTAPVRREGNSLKADFGSGGVLLLTRLGDGRTALLRLTAPFNDQTAVFRKTSP